MTQKVGRTCALQLLLGAEEPSQPQEQRERHLKVIGCDLKELNINPGGRPQQAACLSRGR